MNVNLTEELAQLLEFVASVGIAIRMNSAYNGAAIANPYKDEDVMWLADAIHNLDMLGRAIKEGRDNRTIDACEQLSLAFKGYMKPVPANAGVKGDPKATFERHKDTINLSDAITILGTIQAKIRLAQ